MKTQLEKSLVAFFALFWGTFSRAQTVELPALQVSLARDDRPDSLDAQTVKVRLGSPVAAPSGFPVDAALRTFPEFSLFRRGTSLDLNPSAQGVSLRGIGPSGASRSLVLLDGLPLNDGFGGWVNWTKLNSGALERVEIAPGGAATSWGNTALSGVILLTTRPARPGALEAGATVGSFGTWAVHGSLSDATPAGVLTLEGAKFSRDGATPVRSDQRGIVDSPASVNYERVGVRWAKAMGNRGTLAANARWFTEKRGNGTAGQRNGSRERFASLRWQGPTGGAVSQDASAFVQAQQYVSTFTTVAADRSRETPASEQYDVPSTSAGASWGLRHSGAGPHAFQAGADLRRTQGETREVYSYSNGNYTRRRIAGGAQEFGGAYGQYSFTSGAWSTSASLRHDRWRDSNGKRRETEIATGNALRNESYAARTGAETSPRGAVRHQWASGWSWNAEAYRRFRRPTLNELYRPFRQGSDQTEANPFLRTEHLEGAESGFSWRGREARVSVQGFWTHLDDAVANVTVARGPGTYPEFGFIPAGGSGRRKLNLDRIRVRGVQAEASARLLPGLEGEISYLGSSSEVLAASVAPSLVGRTPPQTPAQVATAGLVWTPRPAWKLAGQARWSSRQFEDDENRIELPAALTLDLSIQHELNRQLTLAVGVRNVADAEVETSRLSTGIVQLGQPREFWASLEWRR